MQQPEVSILVAVYNTQAYLRKCLGSLCNQTISNIQIICIDDASTDGSSSVLDEFSMRDSRVVVIHLLTNRGQAHARNVGLKQAKGKYIAFLDSDDWLAPDSLEQTLKVFSEHPATGCVLFRVFYYYDSKRMEEFAMPAFSVLSGSEAFELSLTWRIHGIYVVQRDIHLQYPYDDSVYTFSDDNTTRLHYLASQEVRCCSGIYFYRQHASSVSHQTSLRRFDYLLANISMKEQLHKLRVKKQCIDIYENHRWLNIIDVYMFYFKNRRLLSRQDAKQALNIIKKAWESIETHRLTKRNSRKFGFIPMQYSWTMFRIQEEIYFSLRKLLGR